MIKRHINQYTSTITTTDLDIPISSKTLCMGYRSGMGCTVNPMKYPHSLVVFCFVEVTFAFLNKLIWFTVQCHYNAINFLQILHSRHPISRASYGVSVVTANSDLCFVSVTRVLYAISYIRLHHNGTRLYLSISALLHCQRGNHMIDRELILKDMC